MKLSNRILWILIILWFILSFYWFYKYFYKLNLINIKISSNVSNFSWSLTNPKFTKDFICKEKRCILEWIPPFEYDIIIYKDSYKNYKSTLKSNIKKIDISLEKDIKIEEIEIKKISREELINNIKETNKNKITFSWNKVSWNKIIWNNTFVYIIKKNKLYFYNINNSNTFSLDFIPKVEYIKSISDNNFIIVTDIWSFVYDVLNQKIEYFSLFSDFIIFENNYIWIINDYDIVRKNNFGFNDNNWNIILNYNFKNNEVSIIDDIDFIINKIYLDGSIIYIENNNWEKFKITWY